MTTRLGVKTLCLQFTCPMHNGPTTTLLRIIQDANQDANQVARSCIDELALRVKHCVNTSVRQSALSHDVLLSPHNDRRDLSVAELQSLIE